MRQLAAVILPARLNSTRADKKLLRELGGKSVLQLAYENACKAKQPYVVGIASDSTEEMLDHAKSFCPVVIKTDSSIRCGTSRVARASTHNAFGKADIIVNVQADEIDIDPSVIDKVIQMLADDVHLDMVTVVKRRSKNDSPSANSTVQAIVDDKGLLDLVRFTEDKADSDYYEHIGIAGFRKTALYKYMALSPSDRDRAQGNEYLTAIDNKFRIGLVKYEGSSKAVNTEEDLEIEAPKPKKKIKRKPRARNVKKV
jgi:3-deoxy-manno-octulosonate cytidylyltransferase (CMP-KDO synthetase)